MPAPDPGAPSEERARVLALLKRWGDSSVSFQVLESDFQYWFADDAAIGYVDTGSAWVAGGAPIADPARIDALCDRFVAAAAERGRIACFFAGEQRLRAVPELRAVPIGEQPVWRVDEWNDILAKAPSLRYQVKRSAAKGVRLRRVTTDEVEPGLPLRRALDAMTARWSRSRGMPPMRFLVSLEPFGHAAERILVVAEQDGLPVALASAIPVYARQRLFVEDFPRQPDAPNGVVEALVDRMMVEAAADGYRELTLGLAPLAGDVPRWMRMVRGLSAPLYDFRGLQAFKTKLRPHHWEPVFLCVPRGTSTLRALRESLRAFAGGSLLGFAGKTLRRPGAVAGELGPAE